MVNPGRVKQFGGKLLGIYTGAVLTKLIDIGYQTGLFEAAKQGPATSEELSERAGLRERYVREWLGGMTTGGVFTYDPSSKQYALPEDHAALLTGNSAQNLAPYGPMIDHFGKHLPKIMSCFRQGGGVAYSAFRPEFTQCMDDMWRRIYDAQLIQGFIGQVDGLAAKLRDGIRVLDIGCGTGHAINILAREFPKSQFVGYDFADDAIQMASIEAKEMGLTNARFDVVDVAEMTSDAKFDLITAFDAIHDQRSPDKVLRCVNTALAPGGIFLMVEFKFSSNLEDNLANPFSAMYYGISLMHCMTVSLALGGPGLGAVWGEQTARRMLKEAGFNEITVVDTPRPQNYIFVCRG